MNEHSEGLNFDLVNLLEEANQSYRGMNYHKRGSHDYFYFRLIHYLSLKEINNILGGSQNE